MAKSTIAALAARKAELIEELREIDAEIASCAGETDDPQTPAKAPLKAAAKSAGGPSDSASAGKSDEK